MTDDYEIDLLENDYWDSEKEQFVLYERAPALQLNPRIKDFDGVIWNCYLWAVKYLPKQDTYQIIYKCY
jgi:hypothetical protein